jgi:hypothetical protein
MAIWHRMFGAVLLTLFALPATAMISGTPGATPRRHGYYPPTYTATPTPSPTPTLPPERAACLGDRNGDAKVTVDELVIAVGIALETVPLSMFPALDFDHSEHVEIHELMIAVNNALDDCPADLVLDSIRPYDASEENGCEVHEVILCVANQGGDERHDFSVVIRGGIYQTDLRFVPGLGAGDEACGTFRTGDIGPLIIGGGELPEYIVEVDAYGEVEESDEGNNIRTVVVTPNAICTPTPTPSGELTIDVPSNQFVCAAEFDITFANTSADEPLVIHSIAFHHGYSQGFYSTGFSVLNADEIIGNGQDQIINGPIVLASGESFVIPVRYRAGANNSRLHVTPDVSTGEQPHAGFILYGYVCPTPTWPAD